MRSTPRRPRPSHFNPRSLRRERLTTPPDSFRPCVFQSTLPAKGATRKSVVQVYGRVPISIHAPCEGSDPSRGATRPAASNFNPRSLRRERPTCRMYPFIPSTLFQSTLPAKGATVIVPNGATDLSISIHAPCEGSDMSTKAILASPTNFNPRSLRRERPARRSPWRRGRLISIHAPCEGSD